MVAIARTAAQLDAVAAETGAVPLVLDVTDAAAVAEAFAHIESAYGVPALLVNNAGIAGPPTDTVCTAPADWWQVFEVNVLGTFLCSRAVLPAMMARGSGRIVNVSSNAAFFEAYDGSGRELSTAYMASKAAVIRFTEVLAGEATEAGVQVFAISPGTVKTEMTAVLFAADWEDPDLWAPPELTAELIELLDSGALDALTGRYLHARNDDLQALQDRAAEIVAADLHTLRVRTLSD